MKSILYEYDGDEFLSGRLDVKDAFTWELFDFLYWRKWMSQHFYVPVCCAIVYLALVFSGRRWMTNRQPYNLKPLLILWNIGFASFSFVAFWRTIPYLWNVVWNEISWSDAFYKSVCSSENLTVQFAFWSWIGVLSKVAELGDTAFVVLRKQRLMFLHWFVLVLKSYRVLCAAWYHHAATMLYTWYTFPTQEPCHRWLMTMNFFVHIIMYSYYALKAGGIKLPKSLAMIITSLQILQMVVGVVINWYTWKQLGSSRGCERYYFNLIVAAIMYTSYLALFANFFYQTYFKGPKEKRA